MRVSRKIFLETKSKIPMNQGIDQTYYFNLFPNDSKTVLEIAKYYTSKTDSLCSKEGIKLKILLLPPKTEVDDTFKSDVMNIFGE